MRRVSCVSMGCVRDPLGWINEGLCSQKGGRSDSHLRAVVRPRDADAKELEMPKNPRMGCSSRSERRETRTEGEIRSSGSSASCFADIAPMSTSPRSKRRESGGALFVVYRLSQKFGISLTTLAMLADAVSRPADRNSEPVSSVLLPGSS